MQTLYLVSDLPAADGNGSELSTNASHHPDSPSRTTTDTRATDTIGSLGMSSIGSF